MIIIVFQIDQQIEDMFASVKRVTDVTKPMVNQQGPPSASNLQKLELAKRLASRINMAKNLGAEAQDITQQAAAAIFKGSMPAPSVSVRVLAGETTEPSKPSNVLEFDFSVQILSIVLELNSMISNVVAMNMTLLCTIMVIKDHC